MSFPRSSKNQSRIKNKKQPHIHLTTSSHKKKKVVDLTLRHSPLAQKTDQYQHTPEFFRVFSSSVRRVFQNCGMRQCRQQRTNKITVESRPWRKSSVVLVANNSSPTPCYCRATTLCVCIAPSTANNLPPVTPKMPLPRPPLRRRTPLLAITKRVTS